MFLLNDVLKTLKGNNFHFVFCMLMFCLTTTIIYSAKYISAMSCVFQYIGRVGTVHRITERGDVRVQYEGCSNRWTFHPGALTKVSNSSTVYCASLTSDPSCCLTDGINIGCSFVSFFAYAFFSINYEL